MLSACLLPVMLRRILPALSLSFWGLQLVFVLVDCYSWKPWLCGRLPSLTRVYSHLDCAFLSILLSSVLHMALISDFLSISQCKVFFWFCLLLKPHRLHSTGCLTDVAPYDIQHLLDFPLLLVGSLLCWRGLRLSLGPMHAIVLISRVRVLLVLIWNLLFVFRSLMNLWSNIPITSLTVLYWMSLIKQ